MTALTPHPWEISDECKGLREHEYCNGYAGGYDTWICRCPCHEKQDDAQGDALQPETTSGRSHDHR